MFKYIYRQSLDRKYSFFFKVKKKIEKNCQRINRSILASERKNRKIISLSIFVVIEFVTNFFSF
jgi:hypothetical protein